MITPRTLLFSIAATAAGFALILGSVIFDAAGTTASTGAEVAQVTALAPRSLPASYGQAR